MNSNTVSILMLTYNHGKYIKMALDSILNQKCNFKYEIVIGDDVSTDNTREVLTEYANKYPEYFKLLLRTQNLGPHFNLLDTLKNCSGKYIAVLEGDDYWLDVNKLQKQYDFFESNNDYVIHAGLAKIESTDNLLNGKFTHDRNELNESLELTDFLVDSPITTCTVMFRNQNFELYPADFLKSTTGDWFLWAWLMQETGLKAFYSKEILAVYRMHGSGLFSSLDSNKVIDYYIKNLGIMNNYIKRAEDKQLISNKIKWFLEQKMRNLIETNKFGALLFLVKNYRNLNNPKKLVSELKNSILN